MWSLGAIAYEMMYRRPPLNAKTHVELASMLNALRTSPLQLPLQPAVSADFAVVLAGLLTHAARARLTLDGLWRTHFVCKGWAEAKILQESEQRCKLDVLRSPSVPPTRPDLVESSYVYVNPARSSDQVAHTPTKWGEALAQDPCRIRTFHNVRSDRRLRKFVKVLAKREGGANVRHAWAVSPHGRRPRDAWEYIAGGSRHAAKLFLHMSPREQKDCVDSLDMARVWPEVRVGAMLNVAKLLTCRGQCVSQLAEERAAAGEQHALAEAASLHMSALSAHSRALDALIVCANQIAQLQSHSNSDAPAQGSHAQRWSDLLWLATQCEPVSPAAKQLVGAMTQSASRAKELLGQLGDRARATDANRVMYEAAMHRARAGALSESSKEWVPAGALSEALVHYENSLLLVEVLASTDCVGQDERLQDLADLLSERILHARLAP